MMYPWGVFYELMMRSTFRLIVLVPSYIFHLH